MKASNDSTATLVEFKIPKYMLVFKDSNPSDTVYLAVLTIYCGYKNKAAMAKIIEIKNNGEAVVMTATKEVINDTYGMISHFCEINDVHIGMDIREEE